MFSLNTHLSCKLRICTWLERNELSVMTTWSIPHEHTDMLYYPGIFSQESAVLIDYLNALIPLWSIAILSMLCNNTFITRRHGARSHRSINCNKCSVAIRSLVWKRQKRFVIKLIDKLRNYRVKSACWYLLYVVNFLTLNPSLTS